MRYQLHLNVFIMLLFLFGCSASEPQWLKYSREYLDLDDRINETGDTPEVAAKHFYKREKVVAELLNVRGPNATELETMLKGNSQDIKVALVNLYVRKQSSNRLVLDADKIIDRCKDFQCRFLLYKAISYAPEELIKENSSTLKDIILEEENKLLILNLFTLADKLLLDDRKQIYRTRFETGGPHVRDVIYTRVVLDTELSNEVQFMEMFEDTKYWENIETGRAGRAERARIRELLSPLMSLDGPGAIRGTPGSK